MRNRFQVREKCEGVKNADYSNHLLVVLMLKNDYSSFLMMENKDLIMTTRVYQRASGSSQKKKKFLPERKRNFPFLLQLGDEGLSGYYCAKMFPVLNILVCFPTVPPR